MRLLTLVLTLFLSCPLFSARPSDPWIFRAVMMEKPRMIMMAFHDNFSTVYEAGNCGLYMVWEGGMQDGNATYTHQTYGNRGATYWPQGDILHQQSEQSQISEEPLSFTTDPRHPDRSFGPQAIPPVEVWAVLNGNTVVEGSLDYRGYALSNNYETATLRYRITLSGQQQINIQEVPEYAPQGSDPGMTRVFTVSGLPAGHTVRLKLTGSTITKRGGGSVQETWTVQGVGTITQQNGDSYFQSGNGETTLTGTWR